MEITDDHSQNLSPGPQITTQYGVTRINKYIAQEVQNGNLVSGTWLEKPWLGFRSLQRMVEADLRSCLKHGTLGWDKPLLAVLTSTLQSAVCARISDVTRSPLYTGVEYLAYKDVKLVLRRGFTNPPTVQDLGGTFTLRYTKGNK